jgi:hypothetical protein
MMKCAHIRSIHQNSSICTLSINSKLSFMENYLPPIFQFCPWLKSSECIFRTFFLPWIRTTEHVFRNFAEFALRKLHKTRFKLLIQWQNWKNRKEKRVTGKNNNFPSFIHQILGANSASKFGPFIFSYRILSLPSCFSQTPAIKFCFTLLSTLWYLLFVANFGKCFPYEIPIL